MILRKLRSICWTALSLTVILLAAAVGLLHLTMPYVGHLKANVEANLATGLKRSVSVGSLSGDFVEGRPLLHLRGLKLGRTERAQAFEVDHAELSVDVLALLRPGDARMFELSILDQELKIVRQRDGRVMLAGIGLEGQLSDHFVLDEGALSLKAARLRYVDEISGYDIALKNIDVRLTREGPRVTIGGQWRKNESTRANPATAALVVELDMSNQAPNGRIYFTASAVDLRTLELGSLAPQLLAGEISGEVWATVTDGEISRVRARPQISDLRLHTGQKTVAVAGGSDLHFSLLGFDLYAARGAESLAVTINSLRVKRHESDPDEGPAGAIQANLDTRGDGRLLDLQATQIRLQDLATVAQLSGYLSAAQRAQLLVAQPSGIVNYVHIRGSQGASRGLMIDAEIKQLSSTPVNQWPGAKAINLRLLGSDREGLLTVNAADGELSWPHLFRETFALKALKLPISYSRDDEGLRIDVPELLLTTQDLSASGRVRLDFPPGAARPIADIQLDIANLEIQTARRYWPLRGFPPRTLSWLDDGLRAGKLTQGEILIRGDLARWPFRSGPDRFEARGRVEDTTLRFSTKWPDYQDFSADLVFLNERLEVTATGGSLLSNPIRTARAVIADNRAAVLELDYVGGRDASELAALIRNSPLHQATGTVFTGLEAKGPARADGKLLLDLRPGQANRSINGRVVLDGVRFMQPQWTLDLTQASGELLYSEKGLTATGVELRDGDIPISLNLRAGASTGDPAVPFVAEGRLHASIQQLVRTTPQASFSLLDRISGQSEFAVEVVVRKQGPDSPARAELSLESDLAGITLGLPAPLDKGPFTRRELSFSTALPLGVAPMRLRIGGLGRAEVLYGDKRIQGIDLALGAGATPNARAGAFTARGSLTTLAIGDWIDFGAALVSGPTPLTLGPLDFNVEKLTYLNRTFSDVGLALASSARSFEVSVDGAQARGTISIPRSQDLALPIRADFSVLQWPQGNPDSIPTPSVDPASIRALRLRADNVQFQRARLGRVELDTDPTPNGLAVTRFHSSTGDTEINAAGTWTRIQQQTLSNFQIDVKAAGLDALLRNFDYAGRVEGAPTEAKFDVSWDGAPADFALERLSGLLSAKVGPGRLPKVDAGAGRIFGLLSLEAIPRRLTLDFSDMFDKGLAFDRIAGDFQLSAGQAYTQGLIISGPSVDITIKGRTGLMARDYAQDMLVAPKLGNTLPIVGALAAGPVGAAAALVVGGILSKPLSQIARFRYSVSGPWDAPKVVPIPASARSPERREG